MEYDSRDLHYGRHRHGKSITRPTFAHISYRNVETSVMTITLLTSIMLLVSVQASKRKGFLSAKNAKYAKLNEHKRSSRSIDEDISLHH